MLNHFLKSTDLIDSPKTEEMNEGYVYFVGATAEVVLESEGESFTTFKAFCELSGKETAETNGSYWHTMISQLIR